MKATTVARLGILSSILIAPSQLQAGELSGSIALDLNSHFISYGADVWGSGDEFNALLFNPSFGIEYAVSDSLSFNAGFWLDVNNEAPGGFNVNETDVWVGMTYDFGPAALSATFQNWQYGGTSEEIIDVALSFDTILNPTLTIHGRLDPGAAAALGGSEGIFVVGGISHEFGLSEALSLGLSADVGIAATSFHTDESGFGYASFGANLSYAVSDTVSIYGGVTYYMTDDDVVGNATSDFLTASTGISFSF